MAVRRRAQLTQPLTHSTNAERCRRLTRGQQGKREIVILELYRVYTYVYIHIQLRFSRE